MGLRRGDSWRWVAGYQQVVMAEGCRHHIEYSRTVGSRWCRLLEDMPVGHRYTNSKLWSGTVSCENKRIATLHYLQCKNVSLLSDSQKQDWIQLDSRNLHVTVWTSSLFQCGFPVKIYWMRCRESVCCVTLSVTSPSSHLAYHRSFVLSPSSWFSLNYTSIYCITEYSK